MIKIFKYDKCNEIYKPIPGTHTYIDRVANNKVPVLNGFDVVEAFKNKTGLISNYIGNQKFTQEYLGYKFLFINQENAEKFKRNPERYIPKYGGFCAWSVSSEFWKNSLFKNNMLIDNTYKLPDPLDGYFAIIKENENKIEQSLFLFSTEDVYKKFITEYTNIEAQISSGGNVYVVPPGGVDVRI